MTFRYTPLFFNAARSIVVASLLLLQMCKNPEAVKKYMREEAEAKQKALQEEKAAVSSAVPDKELNTDFLVGHWKLDIDELKEELRKNSATKGEAELLIKDFDNQYSSIEMEFYDDQRFASYVNGNMVKGQWGISSDKASYYIQLSDDYIELHEVLGLTNQVLVELPVAEVRKAGLPVKQMVYKKTGKPEQ